MLNYQADTEISTRWEQRFEPLKVAPHSWPAVQRRITFGKKTFISVRQSPTWKSAGVSPNQICLNKTVVGRNTQLVVSEEHLHTLALPHRKEKSSISPTVDGNESKWRLRRRRQYCHICAQICHDTKVYNQKFSLNSPKIKWLELQSSFIWVYFYFGWKKKSEKEGAIWGFFLFSLGLSEVKKRKRHLSTWCCKIRRPFCPYEWKINKII